MRAWNKPGDGRCEVSCHGLTAARRHDAKEGRRGRRSALWRYAFPYGPSISLGWLLSRQTMRHRLARGVALPLPPPDGFPVVLGQLPPEEPFAGRPLLPPDFAPLEEPFDVPPELPRVPLWLPPAALFIAASKGDVESSWSPSKELHCASEARPSHYDTPTSNVRHSAQIHP